MPLVTVSAIVSGGTPVEVILKGVAESLAGSLGRPVADVWVRLAPLGAATSGSSVETVEAQHPTFELTTAALGLEREEAALRAVATALADGFGVPLEDVWGRFVALEPGRLISRGTIA